MVNNITRVSIKDKAKSKPKTLLAKSLLIMMVIFGVLTSIIYLLSVYFGYHYNIKLLNDLIIGLIFFILSPLILGFTDMTMKECQKKDIQFSDLFAKLKDYQYLKLIFIVVFALIFGTYLIGLIPIIGIFINLAILILVFPVILMLPFSYLEINGSMREVLSKTIDMVAGHRVRIYGMLVSFIFWLLGSILTCGLLLFYVFPYMYLSLGFLYLNFTHEKEFAKKKGLNDGYVLLIFAGVTFLISLFLMISFPKTTIWFNALLTGEVNTSEEVLSYGGVKISYDAPTNYKISASTDISKTYINNDNYNILQYSIYLSKPKDNLEMDKEIVNEMKLSSEYKVKDKEFTLTVNGKKLKGYIYNTENSYKAKTSSVTVYYPKDSFTISISLSNNNGQELKKEDIKKFVTVH